MKIYPGYTVCTIPKETYPGQTEDVATLGVKAVLVVSSSVSDADAKEMTRFLFAHKDDLANAVELQNELNLDYAMTDIPGGFHVGAAKYYEAQGKEVRIYDGAKAKKVDAKQD